MPEKSGLAVLDELIDSPKVVVVSMHAGTEERRRAHELGAAGFLSKSAPLTDVAAAVRAVAAGCNLFETTPTLREILDNHRDPDLDPGAASLTRREREVLSLMARGITATEELADALFISQKTVKNHLANIYFKLAISDRAQAAVEAIRLGLGPE
jgi:DNA-binding NarL/FixJ family response regulator